jgi:tRNA (adenine37-N6)-methyltransferase
LDHFTFAPIGRIHSCFREKFGIPRQSGLVPEAQALLEILPPFDQPDAFRGLEGFSHIWIVFVFHQCRNRTWKATVRPPRLGGNRRIGVFASRSGFRPNPIGQSVVTLLGIKREKGSLLLHLGGIDLLDKTPVIDIKPYLPYADSVPSAIGGYAHDAPATQRKVVFSPQAMGACRALENGVHPDPQRLIAHLLAQDPRPAYCNDDGRQRFGLRLWDLEIKFRVTAAEILIESIDRDKETSAYDTRG